MTEAQTSGARRQYEIVDETAEREKPRPARRRRRRRAIAAVSGVTAAVMAVGVADAGRGPAARALPPGPLEAQIRERLEPVNAVQSVRCPAAPQRAGHTFECLAILPGGQALQVTVEQLDDGGHVRLQPHV